MKKPAKKYNQAFFLILFANLIWWSACQNKANSNANSRTTSETENSISEKTNSPSDNVEELLELVRLPEIPDEVVWLEEINSKPKRLIAVLKYTVQTARKIVALEEKNKPPEQIEVGLETWFPEELTAQAQLSGTETLKGTAYGANEFFNIPYGNGKITRIEGTDYFVLELVAN